MTRRISRLRALGLAGAGVLLPRAAAGQSAAEHQISVASGGRRLFGTLALPPGRGPVPVVLIIAGSGPTDRDGNNRLGIRSDTYKELAAGLAAAGVASVRYDKRYVGKSNVPPIVDERTIRFEDEVIDAVAWLAMLARDRRFGRTIVAGHSQGSLTGMLAAERTPISAFVSLEGPGRDGATVILEQIAAKYAAPIVDRAKTIVAALEDGETVDDVPAVLFPLFRPSVQPYLMSWIAYKPASEIAQLKCPITIVQGTADSQVSIEDAEALRAAVPSARFVLVENMTHTLKVLRPGVDELRTYLDPTVPIAPQAVEAVVSSATAHA